MTQLIPMEHRMYTHNSRSHFYFLPLWVRACVCVCLFCFHIMLLIILMYAYVEALVLVREWKWRAKTHLTTSIHRIEYSYMRYGNKRAHTYTLTHTYICLVHFTQTTCTKYSSISKRAEEKRRRSRVCACAFHFYYSVLLNTHTFLIPIVDGFFYPWHVFIYPFSKKKWCNRLRCDFRFTFDMFADHWHVVISLNDFYSKRIILHRRARIWSQVVFISFRFSFCSHLYLFTFDFCFFFYCCFPPLLLLLLLLFLLLNFPFRLRCVHVFFFFFSLFSFHHRQCFLLFTFPIF